MMLIFLGSSTPNMCYLSTSNCWWKYRPYIIIYHSQTDMFRKNGEFVTSNLFPTQLPLAPLLIFWSSRHEFDSSFAQCPTSAATLRGSPPLLRNGVSSKPREVFGPPSGSRLAFTSLGPPKGPSLHQALCTGNVHLGWSSWVSCKLKPSEVLGKGEMGMPSPVSMLLAMSPKCFGRFQIEDRLLLILGKPNPHQNIYL